MGSEQGSGDGARGDAAPDGTGAAVDTATDSTAGAGPGAAGAAETGGAARTAPARRPVNSFMWALTIPLGATAAGFLAQCPFGMLYVGTGIGLVVVATTAVIVGGVWNRAGAAVLASMAVFALPFFAGPTAYEAYAKEFGRAVPAVVLSLDGSSSDPVCHVVDVRGAQEYVTERQDCRGQFEPGEHVVLFRDPFGVLHPWLARDADRTVPQRELATAAGLFAATGLLILYGGLTRRDERERFGARRLGPRASAGLSG